MITQLLAAGYAYPAANGDVMYAVTRFAAYGKLSGKRLADLRAGARVEVDESKRDPLDFVLWKHAKPGEPAWESPWGKGRPGWHIECSAMSTALLGTHFDLHGGGLDLKFPHHENEIAQSCAASGDAFVNIWMHNGFVNIDDEKMSKSLGNFFTIREVLAQYDAEVVRFFIARAHYRSPLNYSDTHIDDARNALTRLYTSLKDVTPDGAELDWNEAHAQRFQAAMNDDFNTPVAVSVLFELASEVNRTRDAALARQLRALARIIGLLGREPRAFLQQAAGSASEGALDTAAIEAKIAARVAAKQAKDYAAADRIRAELLEAGVALEDKPGGLTEWRRV
jgi:cysteinyl-tRNA synthetase